MRGAQRLSCFQQSKTPFSFLLSPLRSEDVELNRTLTGSLTAWELFTKTSPQMTKGSPVCVQTEH